MTGTARAGAFLWVYPYVIPGTGVNTSPKRKRRVLRITSPKRKRRVCCVVLTQKTNVIP